MDAPTFRQIFRAFASTDTYPTLAVNFWLAQAGAYLDQNRWGGPGTDTAPTPYDQGTALFTAHHLVLDARDAATAAAGGIPGEVKGPATSKSIDKVSQSYDTKIVTIDSADFWNMTRYGVEFMRLAKQFGAGGLQLGPVGPAGPVIAYPPYLV